MRRLPYLIPVALFLALVAYFALALRPGHDPATLPSAMIDKPAPDFDLAGVAGAPGLSRAALQGHAAIVNFFASWCLPCRSEHPLLMRLSEEEHVPLFGIAYKDKPEDAARFLGQLGDPYRRVGLDETGRVGIDFGVYGVPETYFVDRQGIVRWRWAGPLTPEIVDHQLRPLLKKYG
jgi:cytochrome c biogenesis protein CcmG/thiol:disulfide interchange protein DsbE